MPVDRRLAHDDIIGSIAWAQAIRDAGVLTAAECDRLTAALRELDDHVRDNPGVFDDAADEDIHGWVERELIARALGETGGNVTQAARLLKISRKSLQMKMKELGLRDTEPPPTS
ncbi:MAG: hypothetical protein HS111_04995 [Kofleriaceae bacterium]|nr:hypothetical protein [Kofleriaceae bacterium]